MTPQQVNDCAQKAVNAWLMCGRVLRQVFDEYCADNHINKDADDFDRCREKYYILCKAIRKDNK